MSRITTSDRYFDGSDDCPLGDCDRHYCPEHRLLFRDCDTAVQGTIGDRDVIGGLRTIWESQGECPSCVQEWKIRRFKELQTLGGLAR